MRWSFAFRAAGVVAVAALGSCSSPSSGAFEDFSDPSVLERTESGCRLKIDGAFEVTAPVAIWTDGAILFESSSSRRDVVFVDRVGHDASEARTRAARLDFYVAFSNEELRDGPTRTQVEEHNDSIDVSDLPHLLPVTANHVRVRKDDRDRWLVDVVDTEITGEPRPDTTCSMHFDYDAARR
jgi:hypothetical protein